MTAFITSLPILTAELAIFLKMSSFSSTNPKDSFILFPIPLKFTLIWDMYFIVFAKNSTTSVNTSGTVIDFILNVSAIDSPILKRTSLTELYTVTNVSEIRFANFVPSSLITKLFTSSLTFLKSLETISYIPLSPIFDLKSSIEPLIFSNMTDTVSETLLIVSMSINVSK